MFVFLSKLRQDDDRSSEELVYDLVKMNASDTRSKRLLHEHVTELLSSQSLSTFAHGSAHIEGSRKQVLVMDQVDGIQEE